MIAENPLSSNSTTSDSFFKPYLKIRGKSDTEKEDEQSQTKRKYSNKSSFIDEQPNKRRCKAEKFEAIQYSLGPNEEYIAIRRPRDDERNIDEYWWRIYKYGNLKVLSLETSRRLCLVGMIAKGAHSEAYMKITILKTNTPYPSRKMRRICACTHQRPQRNKAQYAVSRETQYAVFKIWNQYNILEDIKRDPYSKKSPIRRIQYLDTPHRTDFQTL
ncbi:hypothetical protein Tco_0357179 [Tanacetum coccineum]